jgi:acylphosphatase
MTAVKINYRGRVQGVGFRWQTESIASDFDVFGYVKNLDDGSVELVVEGGESVVKSFLSRLAQEMVANISETSEQSISHHGYTGFSIHT